MMGWQLFVKVVHGYFTQFWEVDYVYYLVLKACVVCENCLRKETLFYG